MSSFLEEGGKKIVKAWAAITDDEVTFGLFADIFRTEEHAVRYGPQGKHCVVPCEITYLLPPKKPH